MVETENKLFGKLIALINLVDKLRDIGVEQFIELPKICVLGTQSAGKSSVLESVVGLDCLPRSEGLCTRRPLELRLNHIADKNAKPYGYFEELPGEKFEDFEIIKQKIEYLTDKVAGTNRNIVDKPIV